LYLNAPLRMTGLAMTRTNFSFVLLGKAGTNYVLQANTNLATTNWVPLLTNSSPFGIISFTATNWSAYSNRFFRAQ
jgi:hypothetical protein